MEKVIDLKDISEATLLESLLKEEEIPFYIRDWHDPSFDGIWQEQKGWGCLLAPVEYHDRIREIYKGLKSQE